jgi:ammonia channel protein AmtB
MITEENLLRHQSSFWVIQLHFKCSVVSACVVENWDTVCVDTDFLCTQWNIFLNCLHDFAAFILWFGWYGFNTGSTLSITGPGQHQVVSLVAVNTTLAAASACVASLLASYYVIERKTGEGTFSLSSAMNGCLGGLVSITGGCAVVEPWAAVVIGFIAGLLYLCTSKLLIRLRIDDAVDAIPVHLSNGIWGTIAVGLFASSNRLQLAFGKVADTVSSEDAKIRKKVSIL